jgi:hypothetical protein
MQIEVYGPFNPDGSTMPLWVYEIPNDCERVLVDTYRQRPYGHPPVWGFRGNKQIEGTLVEHNPRCAIMG